MKTFTKNILLKIALLIAIAICITLESNAQHTAISQTVQKVFHPILKITGKLSEGNTLPELAEDRGYLDRGILIFEENLKVCKDIVGNCVNHMNQTQEAKTDSIQSECNTCKNVKQKETDTSVINQKKKPKSFRNYPGNYKSRI